VVGYAPWAGECGSRVKFPGGPLSRDTAIRVGGRSCRRQAANWQLTWRLGTRARRGLEVAVGLLASVALVGCGGSTSPPPQQSEQALTTAANSGTTTTASAPPPQTVLAVTVTSPQGWTYSANLPLPTWRLTFSKDISSSPPGQAVLEEQQSGTIPMDTATLDDTNPGRPNGPTLQMEMEVAYNAAGLPASLQLPEQCDLENAANGYAGQTATSDPFPTTVDCSDVLEPDGSAPNATDNQSESVVDDAISKLNAQTPTYMFSFSTNFEQWGGSGYANCNWFLSPSGQVRRQVGFGSAAPDLAPGEGAISCGKVSVQVTSGTPTPGVVGYATNGSQ
jgi:hypothetical protein